MRVSAGMDQQVWGQPAARQSEMHAAGELVPQHLVRGPADCAVGLAAVVLRAPVAERSAADEVSVAPQK